MMYHRRKIRFSFSSLGAAVRRWGARGVMAARVAAAFAAGLTGGAVADAQELASGEQRPGLTEPAVGQSGDDLALAQDVAQAIPQATAQGDAQAEPGDAASLQAEYDRLFQQMLDRPADLDIMFAFSQVATRIGRYEPAITTLERMLIYNPNLPRVRLELGVLYLRINAPEVARTYFNEALASPDVPEPVRQRAEAYLADIRERTSRHQVAGSLFGGLRYQSNANSGPGSGRVLLGGIDATLERRFREEDDFNAFLSGVVVHRYDLDTPQGEYWETTGIVYGSKQFQLDELDIAILQIDTGPKLALLPDLLPGTTIRPYVVGNFVTLDWKLLFGSIGYGAEIAHQVNERLLLEAESSLTYREFDNSSSFETADDQSGVEVGGALRAHYRLAPDLVLNGELSYLVENARVESESNDEYGVAVSFDYTYPAPFGLDAPPWVVTLGAGYFWTSFEKPDRGVDPTRKRQDEELRLNLLNSFRITEDWSVELQLQYFRNDSNLPNFDRDNLIVTIGGQLTF